jgi:hypothetical protein
VFDFNLCISHVSPRSIVRWTASALYSRRSATPSGIAQPLVSCHCGDKTVTTGQDGLQRVRGRFIPVPLPYSYLFCIVYYAPCSPHHETNVLPSWHALRAKRGEVTSCASAPAHDGMDTSTLNLRCVMSSLFFCFDSPTFLPPHLILRAGVGELTHCVSCLGRLLVVRVVSGLTG